MFNTTKIQINLHYEISHMKPNFYKILKILNLTRKMSFVWRHSARGRPLGFLYSVIQLIFISGWLGTILCLRAWSPNRVFFGGPSSSALSNTYYAPLYTSYHQSPNTFLNRPEEEASNHNYNSDGLDHSSFSGMSSSAFAGTIVTVYAGPHFLVQPGPTDQVLLYSNQTKVSLQCRASGYPAPLITWRVDNLTLRGSDASELRHYFYSEQLSASVMFRHDGQMLVIGGDGDDEDRPYSDSPYQYYQHRVECLASNQFGMIISPPVTVQLSAPSLVPVPLGKCHIIFLSLCPLSCSTLSESNLIDSL